MLSLQYRADLIPNARDLGIEVSGDTLFAPETLRKAFEAMGVRNSDALAAALLSFPTAVVAGSGLAQQDIVTATAGALEKLRPHVDAQLFAEPDPQRKRGMGALPPGWLGNSSR
jgi:hypothetical protein